MAEQEGTEKVSPPREEKEPSPPADTDTQQTVEKPPEPAPAPAAPPPQPSSTSRSVPETTQEKKAREFLELADKKVHSSQTFFGGLFGCV